MFTFCFQNKKRTIYNAQDFTERETEHLNNTAIDTKIIHCNFKTVTIFINRHTLLH